jgi:hypothetical protein
LAGVARHVWSMVGKVGAFKLAAVYAVPVMMILVAAGRPPAREVPALALIVVLALWVVVTAIAALYGILVAEPEQRRAEEEEASRRASAAALVAMKERAYAEARKAEQAHRQRMDMLEGRLAAHQQGLRQAEAQFFQAFATYRAQVDFHGTMNPAELRRGFALNLSRFNLPLTRLLHHSLSPEVRAILELALASPNPPLATCVLKKRRSDGSAVVIAVDAPVVDAFNRLDAEEQWRIVREGNRLLLDPWSVRMKWGF